MAETLKQRVIRADKALKCCERATQRTVTRLSIELGALFTELLGAIESADRNSALVLVPTTGLVASRAIATIQAVSAATVGTALTGGAALLLGAVELANLSQQRATYDTLSLAVETLGKYFATRTATKTKTDDCERCLKDALLSQAAPRKRVRTKILRRV